MVQRAPSHGVRAWIPLPRGTIIRSFIHDGAEYTVILAPQPMPGSAPTSLTEAERTVADLALRSLSNEEIGAIRGTSARTVANQLQSLYRKLKIGSRLELRSALGAPASARPAAPPHSERRKPRR